MAKGKPKAASKVVRNNVGLPADRRESYTTQQLDGAAPDAWAPLKGSGYEKSWPKAGAKPTGSGATSKNRGNGSW